MSGANGNARDLILFARMIEASEDCPRRIEVLTGFGAAARRLVKAGVAIEHKWGRSFLLSPTEKAWEAMSSALRAIGV